MRFEGKLAILIFILAGGWIVYLALFPNMSNIIVASGTMTMAFGTLLMAYGFALKVTLGADFRSKNRTLRASM